MEQLLENLEKHLKETPREVLEQEFFEIDCKMEGIDHTLPNARKLLKRKRRINKLKYKVLPTIRNTACWMLSLWCAYDAGIHFARGSHWSIPLIIMLASVGWLNIFLSYKFGKDYMSK